MTEVKDWRITQQLGKRVWHGANSPTLRPEKVEGQIAVPANCFARGRAESRRRLRAKPGPGDMITRLMLTPDRIYEEELLDAGAGTDDDVARNLQDLRRVNRWLGGTRVILKALERESATMPRRFSLLDVGTGSADIPVSILEWSGRRGLQAAITAVDISARNIRVTRTRLGVSQPVDIVQANSLALPFEERSFDYVTASMFLHHFRDEEVVDLMATFACLARRAIIVNDLVRSLIPYYFARLTGPLLATSFLTRNDGPVSVLRGFTVQDLERLAASAGLNRVSVTRMLPYRVLLVAGTGDR